MTTRAVTAKCNSRHDTFRTCRHRPTGADLQVRFARHAVG
jgi:hypothetical protein